MKINTDILLIFFTLFLSSCMSGDYFETKQLLEPLPSLAETMATEIVTTLKNQVPPAKTTLIFSHKDESLSKLIERKMRDEGFAIASKDSHPSSAPVAFAYTLDSNGEGEVFLRFVLGESFQATRIYEISPSGSYGAVGPLLMRRASE